MSAAATGHGPSQNVSMTCVQKVVMYTQACLIPERNNCRSGVMSTSCLYVHAVIGSDLQSVMQQARMLHVCRYAYVCKLYSHAVWQVMVF